MATPLPTTPTPNHELNYLALDARPSLITHSAKSRSSDSTRTYLSQAGDSDTDVDEPPVYGLVIVVVAQGAK